MPEKNQSCLNCHFFFSTGKDDTKQGDIGYCRANPPVPHFGENGKSQIARFPTILSHMWCGMWDEADAPHGNGVRTV